jgi:GTP-binding protein
MQIHEAVFISSITDLSDLPQKQLPEFAFIGRSNVGKSSLINLLTNRKHLAKISVKPGKTQTINHFMIDNLWYLVDLPGYGYARVSKTKREGFGTLIENYVTKSRNLYCLFVLIDARLKPQPIDIDFINWAGKKEIPMALLFTKSDKVTRHQAEQNRREFENALARYWAELPPSFNTSAVKKTGREEVLAFIQKALAS